MTQSIENRTPPLPEFFSPDVAAARRFYLDLKPSKQRRLAVVCGGVETATAAYCIQRTSFPFYSVEYVTRGRGKLELGGQQIDLRAGLLFSYGPGVPHRITSNSRDALVKYFIDFVGTGAAKLLQKCNLSPGRVASVSPANTLDALFNELIDSGQRGGHDGADLCGRLLECIALKIATARAPLTPSETAAFSTYQLCRSYIEQHFQTLRTLDQIAEECHVSSAYLCRIFRRYADETPYQFLLRLKMNHAAQLLRNPEGLIKQIAADTGFSDPFHFSRVFRSVFGVSPNSFRRLR